MSHLIPVTRPLLPPLEEFVPYLEQIWKSGTLTNAGSMHQALEAALCEYLQVEHVSLFTNGTLALMTALQALEVTGEVITTPYSFVATAHALLWNRLEPVFVDIDPVSMCLDAAHIEGAITPRTTAILPVHCYGTPCNVAQIQAVADRHDLRVIYDAAHAFGVKDGAGSVLRHGDLSILSFHATKVFNTFEGGAIISPDAATKRHIDHLKNFGFQDEVTVLLPGINGKMNEVSAAFGLLQLQHVGQAIARRGEIAASYRRLLAGVPGITVPSPQGHTSNHAYFPILVEPEFAITRDALYARLREHGILARRYFYPLISDFPMYHAYARAPAGLPVATVVAQKVLCLPIYPALPDEDVCRIADLVLSAAVELVDTLSR